MKWQRKMAEKGGGSVGRHLPKMAKSTKQGGNGEEGHDTPTQLQDGQLSMEEGIHDGEGSHNNKMSERSKRHDSKVCRKKDGNDSHDTKKGNHVKKKQMADMPKLTMPIRKVQTADIDGKQITIAENDLAETKIPWNPLGEMQRANIPSSRSKMAENNDGEEKPHLNIIRIRKIMKDLNEKFESEQNKMINGENYAPMIEIKFNKFKGDVLVDTGAQISAMTKALYDDLVESGEHMQVLPIKKFILRRAFSERGSVIANKARLQFEYADKRYEHEFNIVEKWRTT